MTIRRLAAALLLALLTGAAAAQAPAASAPPAAAAAHAAAAALREQVGSPGLAAAVAVDGTLVWAEGFGWADLEQKVAATPDTRFRIGSVSKLFTAALVARLVEAGKLDLDAPIQRYLPEFPDKGQPITARQLAGHLAGIRHYLPADFLLPVKRYASLGEGLAIFRADPLAHAPGSAYLYSSYGYNLLGAVAEAAAGRKFLAALEEGVLAPLGLAGTQADDVERIVERRARPYAAAEGGGFQNEQPIDSSYKWPSGGLLSTAPDLVRFASAHLADGFLRPETRKLLFTSQATADGKETGVGIAWRIGADAAGRRILHHGGTIEGGRAFLLVYPDARVAVAVLTNLSRARFAENEVATLAAPFLP